MDIVSKKLRVTMPNGDKYDIDEFDGSMFDSLEKDTVPLFEQDEYEIIDWAVNNMNWSEVALDAERVEEKEVDFQQGWLNGEKEIVI